MDSKMIRISGLDALAATGRLWRLAVFTAAGVIGATTHARADLFYWQSYSEPYFSRHDPLLQPRPKPRRRPAVKKEVVEKDTGAKPQGPLIISISIDRQKLRLYDANGFFAESPISTGMRGHPTPMGVFSVIQKQKYHRSNIYSGAPMPYMQRITWSGIALHAGVLPGYPASHGCIRMPMPFAIKMWNWTRMGARVIVTPGEMTPESFSHPALASSKVPPPSAAAAEPESNAPVGPKSDKGAPESKAASIDGDMRLKPGVGHDDPAKSEAGKPASSVPQDQTQTADASGPAKDARTMSDATAEPTKSPEKAEEKAATVKADPSATASTDMRPVASEASKDQTRPSNVDKPAVAKPEPPKRTGQIAVFISRKDSKLYVRQNFAPLFEVPVTIAAGDRPLGTHIFTAEIDRSDSNVVRWSVVSLPVSVRYVQRSNEDEPFVRRRRMISATASEARPLPAPNGPAEALDRLTVPPDTMARINEMLTSGSSIIVSDQGINQGETGEGTDFIVKLR
jgi:hypothetical protein